MRQLFTTIDRILRGGFTTREKLREGRIPIEISTLLVAGLCLGIIYGVFMGLFSVMREESPSFLQLMMTTIKVPLLFILTLLVTFPSLYVFSTLAGSRLHFGETLRLLLIGVVLNLALLASFGPVTGFFTLSTESYPFMILLNVIFFTIGGIAGLIFMYRALEAIFEIKNELSHDESTGAEPTPPTDGRPATERLSDESPLDLTTDASSTDSGKALEHSPPPPGPFTELRNRQLGIATRPPNRAKWVFFVWTAIYGVVGAQMGWILRPFIGSPNLPVEFFRDRESDFFSALIRTIQKLF